MYSKNAHVKDTVKASAAIVLCLAILGAFVVILGGYRFWESLEIYHIRFKSVKDLSAGRPVKYGGLDVGRIMGIGVDEEDPTLIKVDIGLTGEVPIRQGVVARIAQKGLVGDYYVFLDPQGKLGDRLPPGSYIPSMESVDLSQLAGMAGEVLMELRPKLERIASSLETMLNSENSARIADLLEKAPKLVDDLRTTSEAIRKDFSSVAKSSDKAIKQASELLKNLDASVDMLRIRLEAVLAEVKKEVGQFGELTGSVKKSVQYDQEELEEILSNVRRLSTDLKHLASRLRERPWEVIQKPREQVR